MTTKKLETIRPFEKPGYTMFKNAILDHIMPNLSGSGWKILCVAIRQTIGWVDEETDSGRKETDRISYTQFMEKSGIGSFSTVSKAIKECLAKGYLLRHPSEDHKQGFDYSLNRRYEMEVETTTETEEVSADKTTPVSGAVLLETTTETEEVLIKTTTVSGDTKERVKQRDRKKRGAGAQKYQQYIQH